MTLSEVRGEPHATAPSAPHARAADEVLASLAATPRGLDAGEAAARLARHGPNAIPAAGGPPPAPALPRAVPQPAHLLPARGAAAAAESSATVDAAVILAVV
jgi:hypothetical protein